jgi:Putative methyltransferase
MSDWVTWHAAYDDPSSSLTARLHRVQHHLSAAIDRAPEGTIRLLSLCAGQGRDVIGVLASHPRRLDVSATLVEVDPVNVEQARQHVLAAHLSQVDVRQADASRVDSFAEVLPADVLLLCGIFGNISDVDIDRTVEATPTLCSAGATVIWTRHRRPPDRTPHIRRVFELNGFDELAFDALDTVTFTGIGVNRLREPQPAPPPDGPMFVFTR